MDMYVIARVQRTYINFLSFSLLFSLKPKSKRRPLIDRPIVSFSVAFRLTVTSPDKPLLERIPSIGMRNKDLKNPGYRISEMHSVLITKFRMNDTKKTRKSFTVTNTHISVKPRLQDIKTSFIFSKKQ